MVSSDGTPEGCLQDGRSLKDSAVSSRRSDLDSRTRYGPGLVARSGAADDRDPRQRRLDSRRPISPEPPLNRRTGVVTRHASSAQDGRVGLTGRPSPAEVTEPEGEEAVGKLVATAAIETPKIAERKRSRSSRAKKSGSRRVSKRCPFSPLNPILDRPKLDDA